MRGVSAMCVVAVLLIATMTRCWARNSALSLWIDEGQVNTIAGYPMQLNIIYKGIVTQFLSNDGFDESLPTLPPEIDTVNLTWEAGDERFTYWFDSLRSKNKSILYNPLLSIPAAGIIPQGPTIFQMSIPCTGIDKGIAHLVLGLQIMDQHQRQINGSPLKIKLKKECHEFETTNLCPLPCENQGRCNSIGKCECPQGFQGHFCEIDMCNPKCENNGTCVSPDMCLCLDGFSGKRCENALCTKPCQNGGRCIITKNLQAGICWCTSGFYGAACEFSYCKQPCQHGGLCIGTDRCSCKDGYSGDQCEKGADSRTRRRIEESKCKRKRHYIKQRCGDLKPCLSRQERIIKKCKSKNEKKLNQCKKRQARLTSRCEKKKKKRKDKCKKKQEGFKKHCSKKPKRKKKRVKT